MVGIGCWVWDGVTTGVAERECCIWDGDFLWGGGPCVIESAVYIESVSGTAFGCLIPRAIERAIAVWHFDGTGTKVGPAPALAAVFDAKEWVLLGCTIYRADPWRHRVRVKG